MEDCNVIQLSLSLRGAERRGNPYFQKPLPLGELAFQRTDGEGQRIPTALKGLGMTGGDVAAYFVIAVRL